MEKEKDEIQLDTEGYATKIINKRIYDEESFDEQTTTLEYHNGFLHQTSCIYYDAWAPMPGEESKPDIKNEEISVCKWNDKGNMIQIDAEIKKIILPNLLIYK